jgi:hypothetical protein
MFQKMIEQDQGKYSRKRAERLDVEKNNSIDNK